MTATAHQLVPLGLPAESASRLALATVRALAYADVFDAPLTAREIHRYLVGVGSTRPSVDAALGLLRRGGLVSMTENCWMLAGREEVALLRQDRRRHARRLWPLAWRYGGLIARLPGVRLVGVSGALAVDNVTADADIDYFIVTAAGRLWTTRAMVVAVVRIASRLGHVLCPNYLLSERAIVLQDRSLFTAHELAQLVPVAGAAMYDALREVNHWSERFLPNAEGPPAGVPPGPCGSLLSPALERVSRSGLGVRFERWEQRRKLARFGGETAREARFGADCCKGHLRQHGQRVLKAYAGVLARLGLEPS